MVMAGGVAWEGDNPFTLLIHLADGTTTVIDLDKHGWATEYADYLRVKATWTLVHKEHRFPPLYLIVLDGEQPYYTARHFRNTSTPDDIVAYGIGKKCIDGTVTRLWVFWPQGLICSGDDVDVIGRIMSTPRLTVDIPDMTG